MTKAIVLFLLSGCVPIHSGWFDDTGEKTQDSDSTQSEETTEETPTEYTDTTTDEDCLIVFNAIGGLFTVEWDGNYEDDFNVFGEDDTVISFIAEEYVLVNGAPNASVSLSYAYNNAEQIDVDCYQSPTPEECESFATRTFYLQLNCGLSGGSR